MKEIKLSEIKGIKAGHAQDVDGATGCTAIICEEGALAGVDVRGGAPASRETELLKSINMVERVHAVVLSGGSAYGLDAGGGVMRFLEERGIGFDVGVGVVPIVCGAALFDLIVGDPKCRPNQEMGYKACEAAGISELEEGNVGAGTGASVGKFLGPERMMKSGLGVYAVQAGQVQCAAIVAVNALGDVIDIDTGRRIAGMLNEEKSALCGTEQVMFAEIEKNKNIYTGNTTLGCIITNAKLTKPQCNKLAAAAHNGYARAIRPIHTYADGDAIFVMSTCEVEANPDALGALAAEVASRAIMRGVLKAKPAYGIKAAEDFVF